jgi:predicted adenine nucleotide alpha hydrolase (AANH) superfamily ATPase
MKKDLLLHTCCAPCFTGCYDQVKDEYNLSIFWYNPNIEPIAEHQKRLETLLQYLESLPFHIPIFHQYNYEEENRSWNEFIKGLENEPEGGKRCLKCFEYRLNKTAQMASKTNKAFTTTLTISPYKDAATINSIGEGLGKLLGTKFVSEDFKKKDGFKKSIQISRDQGLYRQKYCGCRFSINV